MPVAWPKDNRPPSPIASYFAVDPDQPNSGNPLDDAGNVNNPGRNRKRVHKNKDTRFVDVVNVEVLN